MSISTEIITQTTLGGIPLLPLLRDTFYGILGLILVLLFHGSGINYIMLRFERLTIGNLKLKQYNRVFFHFYASFFFIALIHIIEIVIWTFYIMALNLMDNGIQKIGRAHV